MELFYRLLIDAGLVMLLVLSTLIGSLIVSNCWRGIIGLRSLCFSTMNEIGMFGIIFMVVPSFFSVVISSYIYGCIVYVASNAFNYLDVILVSVFFFLCIFLYMGGSGILEELENLDKLRGQEYYDKYYEVWWHVIDEQLIPAVILTLLMMSGLILSYYFNSLN